MEESSLTVLQIKVTANLGMRCHSDTTARLCTKERKISIVVIITDILINLQTNLAGNHQRKLFNEV